VDLSTARKTFLKFEEDLNLFSKKIGGVYFWERIRFKIYRKIIIILGISGQPHTKAESSFIDKIYLKSLYYSILKNPFLSRKKNIIFFGHHRRKLMEDGKWWDIYCDPIIENLNKKDYVYLENPYLNTHLRPSKTENIKYLDIIRLIKRIRGKFNFTKIFLTVHEEEYLNDLGEKIRQYFGINIKLRDIVCHSLASRRKLLGTYIYLLKRIKPKIVILVVSYGKETFIEACKTLNIPTVELQHGTIYKYHFGYSFPGNKRIKRMFPDYFFAFGDTWKNHLELPIEKENIYSVGYPFLENGISKYSGYTKKNQILFISQGSVGKELSKFAVEFSKQNDLNYTIIYKLHPGEYYRWQKKYPWLLNDKIKVVDSDSPPLYQLMAESKIQIGFSSTSIYEGLCFGIKTYLYGDIAGVMDYLLKRGYAERISSPEDLIQKIKTCNNNIKIDTNELFRKNSIENILDVLNCLINRRVSL
jgi:hypothetical protein